MISSFMLSILLWKKLSSAMVAGDKKLGKDAVRCESLGVRRRRRVLSRWDAELI